MRASTGTRARRAQRRSLLRLLALTGLAAALAWLLTRHQAHALQWLPYGILLLCPLMHLFHHRGHGPHEP